MAERRVLRRDGEKLTVLVEQRIPAESDLQRAFIEHPEALPSADIGLGTLVSLGWELDFGAGPLDQLAVDRSGRPVVVEFKKGTENPDVREVVAQMLDYGSSLWRLSYEGLEARVQDNGSYTLITEGMSLADHVGARLAELGEPFDPQAFEQGLRARLDDGSFVFAYVARDLDDRTRRVLTYLADGAHLDVFAVEVDWFGDVAGGTVIVPRVAFVPSWIIEPDHAPSVVYPEADELAAKVEQVASSYGIAGKKSETGRRWGEPTLLGVYRSSSGVMFWFPEIEQAAGADAAAEIRSMLERFLPSRKFSKGYPMFAPRDFINRWPEAESEVFRPLFEAVSRMA